MLQKTGTFGENFGLILANIARTMKNYSFILIFILAFLWLGSEKLSAQILPYYKKNKQKYELTERDMKDEIFIKDTMVYQGKRVIGYVRTEIKVRKRDSVYYYIFSLVNGKPIADCKFTSDNRLKAELYTDKDGMMMPLTFKANADEFDRKYTVAYYLVNNELL